MDIKLVFEFANIPLSDLYEIIIKSDNDELLNYGIKNKIAYSDEPVYWL